MSPSLEKDPGKIYHLQKLLPEVKTPVFLTFSSFIFALLANYYNLPLYLTVFPIFIYLSYILLFSRKKSLFFWWSFSFFIFFSALSFFSPFSSKRKLPQNPEEYLIKIKKVEPFFQGFLVYGYGLSTGNIVFKTKNTMFKPGDVCILKVVPFYRNILNPFSISGEEFLKSSGLSAKVKLVSTKPLCKEGEISIFEKLRFKLFMFSEEMPPVAKGLFQALVLGVKRNIPFKYLRKLKLQGVYHLLAISGFHLAVIFGLFYFLFLFLLRHLPLVVHHPLQNIAGILALPPSFLIVLLSGFYPSALRAFVFFSIFIFSRLIFKDTSSLIILIITAVLSLVFQPFLVGNVSFQLSFLAVFSLILADRLFKNYILPLLNNLLSVSENPSKILNFFIYKIFYSIFASLVVSFILCPFIIYLTGNFPLATPINNLVAGFFWGFIFIPLSFLIAFFSFFWHSLALTLSYLLEKSFYIYLSIPLPSPCFIPEIPVNLFFLSLILTPFFFLIFKNLFLKHIHLQKTLKIFLAFFVFYGSFFLVYKTFSKFYQNIPAIILFDTPGEISILFKTGKHLQENYLLLDEFSWCKNCQNQWKISRISAILKKLGIKEFSFFKFSENDQFSDIYKAFTSEKLKIGEKLLKNFTFLKTPEGNAEFFFFNNPFLFYAEIKGLTFLYARKPELKKLYLAKLEKKLIFSEVCLFRSKNHFLKIKGGKITKWLHPYLWILRKTFKEGAIYLFPKKNYFLFCSEAKRRSGLWSSILFPFIPYYFGEKITGCKKYFYHRRNITIKKSF